MNSAQEKLSKIIEDRKKDLVIVLSRKGMDTVTGKMASPIFYESYKLLSLPIPIINEDEFKYEEKRISHTQIQYNNEYLNVINNLNENFGKQTLHFDPLLDNNAITATENIKSKFVPSLGQCGPAATYILNGFDENDIKLENTTIIFLFFGRFHFVNKNNKYIKNYKHYDVSKPYLSKDLHVIWGYLVVDDIVSLNEDNYAEYSWHPHSTEYYISNSKSTNNNTLFISNGNAGVFKFDEKLILTNTDRKDKSKDIASAIWRKDIFTDKKFENTDKLPFDYCGDRKNSASDKENELFLKGQWQELILTNSKECKYLLKKLGIITKQES